jgi:spermidine export protein MdtI
MLPSFALIHLFYLGVAIVLEVAANVLMKMSHGFKYKRPFFLAMICVLTAFTSLSFAVRGIPLSIAYAIWGGVGLVATALLGIALFRERLRISGWCGIGLILVGVWIVRMGK